MGHSWSTSCERTEYYKEVRWAATHLQPAVKLLQAQGRERCGWGDIGLGPRLRDAQGGDEQKKVVNARDRHGHGLLKRPVGLVGAGGQMRRRGEAGEGLEKGVECMQVGMICRRDFWWSQARVGPLAPICCQGAGVGLRTALEDATLDEEGDNLAKAMFQTGRQSCPRPSSACCRDGQV